MNLALAPTTLTTGWSPIVLVTTPPQPASKARRMLLSDSVGGAEERRNGFSNWIPVKVTDLVGMGADPLRRMSWLSARRGQAQGMRRGRGRRGVRRQGLGGEHTLRAGRVQRR